MLKTHFLKLFSTSSYFLIISCILLSCSNPVVSNIKDFEQLDLGENRNAVFLFWSTECPLCQNYTNVLNEMQEKHPSVAFYLVFQEEVSEKEIQEYCAMYQLNLNYFLDTGGKLTTLLHATVTPQVVVYNTTNGELYSGKIDNWMEKLGVKRQIITEYYLQDVLQSIENNEKKKFTNTEPIGCFIE